MHAYSVRRPLEFISSVDIEFSSVTLQLQTITFKQITPPLGPLMLVQPWHQRSRLRVQWYVKLDG